MKGNPDHGWSEVTGSCGFFFRNTKTSSVYCLTAGHNFNDLTEKAFVSELEIGVCEYRAIIQDADAALIKLNKGILCTNWLYNAIVVGIELLADLPTT